MAITSRDLHQPAPRHLVSDAQWPVQIGRLGSYVRLGLWILFAAMCLSALSGWGKIWIDDVRYGRPRTHQLSGRVGHNEAGGELTHFVAMNINRRVVVIELPGGDVAKAQTLQGPYLFGANEDLTPVILRVQDINADGKNDLIVGVKHEEIVYVNTGDAFRLITAEERQQMEQ